MAVKALYDYTFPSRDRQELYGDDILVYVGWLGNPLISTPACFRVPKAISFAEFKSQFIDPWAATDPDYDPAGPTGWEVNGDAAQIEGDSTLDSIEVGHKGLITFQV